MIIQLTLAGMGWQMSEHVVNITKPDLISRIQMEHQLLETTLARLDSDEWLQPGVEGDWSVKDILAHLTSWEERMRHWLVQTRAGDIPQMPAPGLTWSDLDRVNHVTFLENRDKPLEQVKVEFKQSFQDTVVLVSAVDEQELTDRQRYPWRDGEPLWMMIAANTWWHYQMHNQSIKAWLK